MSEAASTTIARVYNASVAKPLAQDPPSSGRPGSAGKLRTACLDEDAILAFVMGETSGDRRQRVLDHIDTCEACRSLSAALARDDDVAEARSRSAVNPDASLLPEDDDPPVSRPFTDGEIVNDRFRLLEVLGRGAMGSVYRAHDTKQGTDVALKLFHRTDTNRAFERELKVGRRISHPNVCRLYDSGLYDGIPYITMGLVEGETLADLAHRERLTLGEAVPLLLGIAAGLAAVHAQGVVHRDLKPANVMIERATGEPILTDFGFAADLESKQSRRLVGTPSFWAPEQARGESPTRASDVYSFGVLAYQLLTGQEFSLSNPRALDAVPRAYRAVIGRCLEPRPSDRFPDAKDVEIALRRAGRPRVPLFAGAAAGVALLAVGLYLGFGRGPAPTVTPSASAERTAAPMLPLPPPTATPATASPTGEPHASPPVSVAVPGPAPAASDKARPSSATLAPHRHPPVVGSAAARPSVPPPAASQDDPLYRH
jgi:serine/threonine protein kinase